MFYLNVNKNINLNWFQKARIALELLGIKDCNPITITIFELFVLRRYYCAFLPFIIPFTWRA